MGAKKIIPDSGKYARLSAGRAATARPKSSSINKLCQSPVRIRHILGHQRCVERPGKQNCFFREIQERKLGSYVGLMT